MATSTTQVKSIYRSILRELPRRPLSTPSPIQQHIRHTILKGSVSHSRMDEAEQFVQYAKAQRMYATLLERYNPGMSINEEDKVRLSAKRVGMTLPEEFKNRKDDGS